MRSLLVLGIILVLSGSSFGFTEPDRQNLDLVTSVSEEVVFENSEIAVATDQIFLINQDVIHTDLSIVYENDIPIDHEKLILSEPIQLRKHPTDLVVEEDTKKARGEYILPIWDYKPSIKPPSLTK